MMIAFLIPFDGFVLMKKIIQKFHDFSIVTLSTGLVDFAFAIYNRYDSSENSHQGDNTGYSAHIGGGAAGFLIGMNILRNFHHKVYI